MDQMIARSTRLTREAFLARLALRPSAQRLGEFEELDDADAALEALIGLVERVEGMTPEQIAELSAEYNESGDLIGGELFELRQGLAAGYRAAPRETDEQVDALTSVVAAITAVDTESNRRVELLAADAEAEEAARLAREATLAELDAAVGGDEPGDGDGSGGDGTEGNEPGTEGDAPAEGTEGAPAEGEPVGAGAAQASGRPAPAPAGRRANLGVLQRRRPEGNTEQAPAAAGGPLAFGGRVVASTALAEIGRGDAFESPEQLGQIMARMSAELQSPTPNMERKHYLGRAAIPRRERVVLQADFVGEDRDLIDAAVRRNLELKQGNNRRVASGGVCIWPQPDYTLTTVGDRGAAWLDRIPTIQGNRPISYIPWILMSLTATPGSRVGARPVGGIGTVTAAQDAAGYGPPNDVPVGGHAYKDCVRIDCPSPVTCGPEATFKCTEVGNFQAVTWPEYVRTFDETVGFYFDVYRDERALAQYVAQAKTLNGGAPVFGAAVDLLDRIRRLVAQVRSVRKAPNMAFNVDVPRFARSMLAQDIASSWGGGTDNLRVTPEQALALLAIDEGIMIGEYDVSIGLTATGQPTVLPELVDGQDLPDWLSEIRILVYPEGGVFRQDYGELAFGLRETGMETNDFRGFYEVMESQCYRTTDLFTLDVELCVNGARGAAVAKLCGSAAGEGINEIQRADPGDSTGGSFTLTFDGETTAAIAWNASDATMKTRLTALSNIGPDDVATFKVGTAHFIQFTGKLGGQDQPLLVADSTNLTGGAHTATVTQIQAGG